MDEVKQLLFACSKCFRRCAYEEIFTSNDDNMVCGDCRKAMIRAKCLYCGSEYQQSSKSSNTSSVYPKRSSSSKLCTTSEYEYSPPVKCKIYQQICAFDRDNYRVDGKLHCWPGKLSYKHALVKGTGRDKKIANEKNRSKKRPAENSQMNFNHDSKAGGNQSLSNRGNGNSNNNNSQRSELAKIGLTDMPEMIAKTANSDFVCVPNNSDHVVAITLLEEEVATLQKKLQQKDSQLLQKEKEITEWKGNIFAIETEMQNKMKDHDRVFDVKIDVLNKKIHGQQKEIAQLSKRQKRSTVKELMKEK